MGRMPTRRPDEDRIALLQGTLDLLILRTLLFGKQHGQGIARAIQASSGDELLVDHGSLYPALQRLEGQRLGRRGVGYQRRQSKGAILPSNGCRKETTHLRNQAVGADRSRSRRVLVGENPAS